MDALLEFVRSNLERQATGLAFRSTMIYACTFTYDQCKRYRRAIHDKTLAKELKELQQTLNTKIRIISPVIDLIEQRSGRGNAFLESAAPLTQKLHRDIVSLGRRLENAAADEEALPPTRTSWDLRTAARQNEELKSIIAQIKALSKRIDENIPLLQLAITASGENMSQATPPSISLSRLMQASTFLREGDMLFMNDPSRPVQIGPTFVVSCYMLFLGHSETKAGGGLWMPNTPNGVNGHSGQKKPEQQSYGLGEGERKPIWQEVMHKARVRICRTPMGWEFAREKGYRPNPVAALGAGSPTPFGRPNEFSYHLEMIEDLDDGRLHDDNDAAEAYAPYHSIVMAGIRESIPVHQISKVFYTDTGKILNIGSAEEGENNPVLLLKRDASAPTPGEIRREHEKGPPDEEEEEEEEPTALPALKHGTGGLSDSDSDDEQAAMDRQLQLESDALESPPRNKKRGEREWRFPQHVDQEWIALEIFAEDENLDSDQDDEDDEGDADSVDGSPRQLAVTKSRLVQQRDRSSVDSNLLAQIRNISLRSDRGPPSPGTRHGLIKSPSDNMEKETTTTTIARPPFGVITTSLSLMETLIRLTSVQEFQQTSHLAIPEHILTFFLAETSTTGVHGDQKWQVRNEAKKRVGFDPYTDTPTK